MSHVLAISKAFIACLDRSEPHERPEKDIAWGSTAGTSTKGPQDAAPESPAGPGHAPVCGIVADMHVPLKALLLCKYTMIPSCGRLRRVDWSLVDGAALTPSPGAPYRAPESPFHGIRGAEHHPAVSTTHSKYASVINACTGLQAGTLLHSLLGFKSPPTSYLACPTWPKISQAQRLSLGPQRTPQRNAPAPLEESTVLRMKGVVVGLHAERLSGQVVIAHASGHRPRSDDAGNQTRGNRAVRGTAMTPAPGTTPARFSSDPTPSLFQVAGSGSQFGKFPST